MRLIIAACLFAISFAQTVISNGKDLSEEAIGERCSPANLLYNGNAADEVDCAEIAQGLDSDTMYFSWRLDRLKCEVPDVLSAGTDCDGGATTGVPLWTIWKITEQGADACGVSGGDGSSCAGCDNIPNSGLSDDACGICDGDGSTCAGCDNIPNSGLSLDICGVCGGDGSSCDGGDDDDETACTSNSECGDGYCNFDATTSGTCESCADVVTSCSSDNFFTSEGEAACIAVCEPDDSCSDDDNTVNGLFADWMGISHCASVNLEINGITCDRTFQSMVDQGMSWVFADVDAALAAASLAELCGCTCGGDSAPEDSSEDGDCLYTQPICKMQKIFADDEGSVTDKEDRFFAVGKHVKRVLRTNEMDDGSKPQAKWMWQQMKDIVKFEAYSRNSFWRLEKQFENLVAWMNENENFMG